ncbi:MAG: DUF721 domain-containing protein [Fervidobacterium sp.]
MLTIKLLIKELSKVNSFFEKIYILSTLEEASEEILGDHISKHSKFIDYKEGTLYIECDDYIWATETRRMSRQIKKKIIERLQLEVKNIKTQVRILENS